LLAFGAVAVPPQPSPNVARVLSIYEALQRRDLVALQRIVSPQVTLHLAGANRFSGSYEGIGAVMARAAQIELRLVPSASELEAIEEDGDTVRGRVLVTFRSTLSGDFRARLFETFRFDDTGRLCEIRVEAEDQPALDDFLTP
jgi:SnoaL-like domain